MADNESGPEAGAKGVVEGVKGKVKEVAGAVTGNDGLQAEGEAQGAKQQQADLPGEPDLCQPPFARKDRDSGQAARPPEGQRQQARGQGRA